MSAAKPQQKGPALYKHWKRPHTRMYDYNYQVAESYYKPQVQYAGYIGNSGNQAARSARRRSVSPPAPQSFLERWAANPFYGKNVDRIDLERESMVREQNRARAQSVMRASSVPREWIGEEELDRARQLRSSVSRARSVFNYDGDYVGDYNDYVNIRRSRARSVSTSRPLNDIELGYEYDRDREFDDLVRLADRGQRERSVFEYRMALDPDPTKIPMTTRLSHGCYQNSLYGTFTWDPASYSAGR